jgi:hypothetical protein
MKKQTIKANVFALSLLIASSAVAQVSGSGQNSSQQPSFPTKVKVEKFKSTNLQFKANQPLKIDASAISQKLGQNIQNFKADAKIQSMGGINGGGGSGVVFPDESVRFVDTLDEDSFIRAESSALNFTQVRTKIFKPVRYVRVLAKEDTHFFDCASSVLEQYSSEFPVLNSLVASLPEVQVLQVNFQLPTVSNSTNYAALNLKFPIIASASSRLPSDRQVALAVYANNQVWVSSPLYRRLNDSCGISIHEALRQLNYGHFLTTQLTQDEIEAATRYFLGKSLVQDREQLFSAKNKFTATRMTASDYEEEIAKQEKLAKGALKEILALGSKPSSESEASAWEQKAQTLGDQLDKASARVSKLTAHSVSAGLSKPDIAGIVSTGIVENVFVTKGLVEPRKDGRSWDIYNLDR